MITVITPTTGKNSLFNSIKSLQGQSLKSPIHHILLWDNKREDEFLYPNKETLVVKDPMSLEVNDKNYTCSCIVMKSNFVKGKAAGSSLRAIGLMAADSEFVTFMDDDVMWDSTHLESMITTIGFINWAFCKRRIWRVQEDGSYECLGVDEFESVGEKAKTPYKMVDNNCMMFRREFGVSAACLYRNTNEYNDDRLMYAFLNKYAGTPSETNLATVNQVCPARLEDFFRTNCTKEAE